MRRTAQRLHTETYMRTSSAWSLGSGLVATLLLALPIGCSAVINDDGGTGVDNLASSDPILPADLLECWVVPSTESDPFFQQHDVRCGAKSAPKYPLHPARYIVEVQTARHDAISAIFTEGEKSLGRVRNDDFPLQVFARISFDRAAEIGSGFTLKHTATLTSLATATPTARLNVKAPFTFWPLEIRSPANDRLVLTARYNVPTKGFRVGSNFNIPETDPEEVALQPFVELQGGAKEFALIAPVAGGIDVQIRGKAAKIPGPGTYSWDGENLVKVENDRPPPPPVVGSTPAPAPTCGTNAQAPCAGNTCAPSHRLDSTSGKCVACGGDGETFCLDASGSRICKDAHRFDSTDGKCHACGANGQTFCLDARGTRFCNASTRLDSNDGKCKSCGANAQTFCLDDRGSRFCNAGTRLDSNDGMCKSCGGNGQTFCLDDRGSRICNDGHRLDSNDGLCKVCGGEGQTFCMDSSGRRICNPGLRLDSNTGNCIR